MKKLIMYISVWSLIFPATALADDHNSENELPIPAIVIEEEIEEPEDPAWTYKFLIPTSVAIATLVILGNVVQYFRQVTRTRYKVKE
ncbi:hypothetical protein OAH44_01955 [Acidimicrobiia bacterium]|nr:hypothetical protein [Acidimicrobiia bacterium]